PYRGSWVMHLVRVFGNWYHDRLYGERQVGDLTAAADLRVLDMWHRQLFPKNRVPYPFPYLLERLDQWLTEHTPLRYLATSLEFVATPR
ncbi:MAG: class I SAM-dependent methyltransferase, partial [Candidatus Eremiobacterota bacterium]